MINDMDFFRYSFSPLVDLDDDEEDLVVNEAFGKILYNMLLALKASIRNGYINFYCIISFMIEARNMKLRPKEGKSENRKNRNHNNIVSLSISNDLNVFHDLTDSDRM